MAVFAFLPICQLKRANVLVGAFTKNLPVRVPRPCFDLAANLLFFVLTFALAFQLGHRHARESSPTTTPTMVLRIPEGWAYAVALAFAWLLVIATAYTVARSVAGDRHQPRHRSADHPGSTSASPMSNFGAGLVSFVILLLLLGLQSADRRGR